MTAFSDARLDIALNWVALSSLSGVPIALIEPSNVLFRILIICALRFWFSTTSCRVRDFAILRDYTRRFEAADKFVSALERESQDGCGRGRVILSDV